MKIAEGNLNVKDVSKEEVKRAKEKDKKRVKEDKKLFHQIGLFYKEGENSTEAWNASEDYIYYSVSEKGALRLLNSLGYFKEIES
ncbi:MAG: hypothetical protein IH784_04940 [Bacteroidetes bacterium]|nr:hypothetical protein [Bacteroidota bacterium]